MEHEDVDSDDQVEATTEGTKRAIRRWTPEEHATLAALVAKHSSGSEIMWAKIAQEMPNRTGKQCRHRWINSCQPNTKRGVWDLDEEHIVAQLHAIHGSSWSLIAGKLSGRSENSVKNHYNALYRSKYLDSKKDSVLANYVKLLRDGQPQSQATYEAALGLTQAHREEAMYSTAKQVSAIAQERGMNAPLMAQTLLGAAARVARSQQPSPFMPGAAASGAAHAGPVMPSLMMNQAGAVMGNMAGMEARNVDESNLDCIPPTQPSQALNSSWSATPLQLAELASENAGWRDFPMRGAPNAAQEPLNGQASSLASMLAGIDASTGQAAAAMAGSMANSMGARSGTPQQSSQGGCPLLQDLLNNDWVPTPGQGLVNAGPLPAGWPAAGAAQEAYPRPRTHPDSVSQGMLFGQMNDLNLNSDPMHQPDAPYAPPGQAAARTNSGGSFGMRQQQQQQPSRAGPSHSMGGDAAMQPPGWEEEEQQQKYFDAEASRFMHPGARDPHAYKRGKTMPLPDAMQLGDMHGRLPTRHAISMAGPGPVEDGGQGSQWRARMGTMDPQQQQAAMQPRPFRRHSMQTPEDMMGYGGPSPFAPMGRGYEGGGYPGFREGQGGKAPDGMEQYGRQGLMPGPGDAVGPGGSMGGRLRVVRRRSCIEAPNYYEMHALEQEDGDWYDTGAQQRLYSGNKRSSTDLGGEHMMMMMMPRPEGKRGGSTRSSTAEYLPEYYAAAGRSMPGVGPAPPTSATAPGAGHPFANPWGGSSRDAVFLPQGWTAPPAGLDQYEDEEEDINAYEYHHHRRAPQSHGQGKVMPMSGPIPRHAQPLAGAGSGEGYMMDGGDTHPSVSMAQRRRHSASQLPSGPVPSHMGAHSTGSMHHDEVDGPTHDGGPYGAGGMMPKWEGAPSMSAGRGDVGPRRMGPTHAPRVRRRSTDTQWTSGGTQPGMWPDAGPTNDQLQEQLRQAYEMGLAHGATQGAKAAPSLAAPLDSGASGAAGTGGGRGSNHTGMTDGHPATTAAVGAPAKQMMASTSSLSQGGLSATGNAGGGGSGAVTGLSQPGSRVVAPSSSTAGATPAPVPEPSWSSELGAMEGNKPALPAGLGGNNTTTNTASMDVEEGDALLNILRSASMELTTRLSVGMTLTDEATPPAAALGEGVAEDPAQAGTRTSSLGIAPLSLGALPSDSGGAVSGVVPDGVREPFRRGPSSDVMDNLDLEGIVSQAVAMTAAQQTGLFADRGGQGGAVGDDVSQGGGGGGGSEEDVGPGPTRIDSDRLLMSNISLGMLVSPGSEMPTHELPSDWVGSMLHPHGHQEQSGAVRK